MALFPAAQSLDDDEHVRRYTGAMLVAEAFQELTIIRKALTTEKK